ncbi:porin [Novosphingobium sp. KCTC 2891]|uniref:porin n=1 Tax=Novosphingobium sp. KCTC 2891 TaxID=2989730 RepID=UPI002221CDBB|nr:porin [Novosphingobium sp. KCTC 2891]MCW1384957.1 porin [Novosphingobium sp. KCTC 2891]
MNKVFPQIRAVLMAATALGAPVAVHARPTAHEAELEARLEKLEQEMIALRGELHDARAQQADALAQAQQQAASTVQARTDEVAARTEQVETRMAALEGKPRAEGFRSGDATFKIGGYLRLLYSGSRFSGGTVANNTYARDLWFPQGLPVGGKPSTVADMSARQSRFWLNFTTDVGKHVLKGYLETDFETAPGTQGSQRTTNGYNLAMRRAYVQLDRWTFGQDWTTFQYPAALPESTDYVGTTEGTVFARQPLLRYSAPVAKGMTLHLAVENPETASAVQGAPALVENGADHVPDLAARLAYAGDFGELSLGGIARQLRVVNAGTPESRFGWGVSGAGKLFLDHGHVSDVRFMLTHGHGIGRYMGLNFGPDAVLGPAGALEDVGVTAGMAAVRLAVTPKVRVNLMGSFQTLDYSSSLVSTSIGTFNKSAWSAAANVFWTPYKNVDLGIELRHGARRLVNGTSGALDRVEIAAKYGF